MTTLIFVGLAQGSRETGYVAQVPDLPGVTAEGADLALLLANAREAVLKALKNPSFKSLRGEFQYGANNFPVQNYYLREVGKDAEGRITNKLVGMTLEKHQDAYVGACKM